MKTLAIALLAGAAALSAGSARASDIYVSDGYANPDLVQQVRLVCDQDGNCYRSRAGARVIVRDSYNNAPRERYYERRTYRDYDDRWSLAFLLEDIGMLAAACGDAPSALELVGTADAIRERIGAPRSPSLEQEMERQLAPAGEGMSEEDRAAHRGRGRSLDLAVAVDRAFALCGTP